VSAAFYHASYGREPYRVQAGILAAIVHGAFFALLYFGFSWQTISPAFMNVELWQPEDMVAHEVVKPPPPPPRPKKVVVPDVQSAPPKKVVAPDIKIPDKKKIKLKPVNREAEKRKAALKAAKVKKARQEQLAKEQAAKAQAERERIAKEQAAKEQAERERIAKEQAAKEQAERERIAREQAAKEQAERERIAREQAAREQADRERAEQAAAIGKVVDEYIIKIRAKIRHNIIMPANVANEARAEFSVTLLPGGGVLQAKLLRTSGSELYDSAVERAILKSDPLPLPPDVKLFNRFRNLKLSFKPVE
jgi:colicin import membrane protein